MRRLREGNPAIGSRLLPAGEHGNPEALQGMPREGQASARDLSQELWEESLAWLDCARKGKLYKLGEGGRHLDACRPLKLWAKT